MKNKLSTGLIFSKLMACQIILFLLLTACSSGFGLPFDKNNEIKESVELSIEQKSWLTDNINDFSFNSSPLVISDKTLGNKNLLYSPASLYIALSMLYECADTDSATKAEIEKNLQPISEGIQSDMGNSLYQNLTHHNETGSLYLENSILMKKGTEFPENIKKIITDKYYGDVSEIENHENDITQFVIRNSILFEGKWYEPFGESEISTEFFTMQNGEMLDCQFMNRAYYKNKKFIISRSFVASALYFKNGYAIHFILPNEGISPIELINKPDALKLAIDYSEANSERVNIGDVYFKIPKVKFESEMDLNDTMKRLGITSAYTGGFSALDQPNDGPIVLDSVFQTSYFELNEEGARAEAITEIGMMTSSAESQIEETQELYLYLTRPFLLQITSTEGYVLFTGIVNNPNDTGVDSSDI